MELTLPDARVEKERFRFSNIRQSHSKEFVIKS
jgi:hypothetical protein